MTAQERDGFPPAMPPAVAREFKRRRRGRNVAILVALIAFSLLFYLIAVVKMTGGGS